MVLRMICTCRNFIKLIPTCTQGMQPMQFMAKLLDFDNDLEHMNCYLLLELATPLHLGACSLPSVHPYSIRMSF